MTKTLRHLGLSTAAGLAALALTAGMYASSQDPNTNKGGGPFMGRRGGPPMGGPNALLGPGILGPQLGLSDAQKEQIKSILQAHAEDWKAITGRMMTARQALDESVDSGAVNESLIRQRSAEVGLVEGDAAVVRARVRAEVLQLLTPDQQAKAREFAARRPGPGHGRGRGQGQQ